MPSAAVEPTPVSARVLARERESQVPPPRAHANDAVAREQHDDGAPEREDSGLQPTGPAPSNESSFGRRHKRLIAGVLAFGALLALGVFFLLTRGLESTDNAQVDADVVAVPARIAGTVEAVHFSENQRVHAGDLLAELDARELRAKLAQAEANLGSAIAAAEAAHADASVGQSNAVEGRALAAASVQTIALGARGSEESIREGRAQLQAAEAKLVQARHDAERARELFAMGAYTRVQRDDADTALELATTNVDANRARLSGLQNALGQSRSKVAEASANLRRSDNVKALVEQAEARAKASDANVEIARAARDLAVLDLSYTRIVAPHDGVVSKKAINPGQSVSKGQSIVQLVPDERWVTANFKETQLEQMRVGQPVSFTVDTYPGVELHGDVESLSGATGSRFTLLPPDNATGNFTKVVQRVPVRIRVLQVPNGVSLRPGMSVELTVDTRSHKG